MKKILTALFIGLYFIAPTIIKAQEYDDLLVLYVDEKYEKCYSKSLKYQVNDKTKNDPLPYLYCSMSLYGMSQDHKYKESYPKAYTNALKFAAKYRKKDKEFAYKEESLEYLELLKTVILEEADNYILKGEEKYYRKAKGIVKKATKLDPDCRGAVLLHGELEILAKNKSEGKKIRIAGLEGVKKIGDDIQFGDMTETQQRYFKYAVIFSAKLQLEKDPTMAKEIISIGQPYFGEEREDCLLEDNSDFVEAYKLITG